MRRGQTRELCRGRCCAAVTRPRVAGGLTPGPHRGPTSPARRLRDAGRFCAFALRALTTKSPPGRAVVRGRWLRFVVLRGAEWAHVSRGRQFAQPRCLEL